MRVSAVVLLAVVPALCARGREAPARVSDAPPAPRAECADAAADAPPLLRRWEAALAPDGATLRLRLVAQFHFGDTLGVEGGRLVSEDHGEFGGHVWFEPASAPGGRSARQSVAEMHVKAFVAAGGAIYGLEGHAHLSPPYGYLVRLERAPGGGWSARRLVDLREIPYAGLALGADTLLVATDDAVLDVRPHGRPRDVLRWGARGPRRPTSVVRDRAGVVYVSSEAGGLARLTPAGRGRYRADWLALDVSGPGACRLTPVPWDRAWPATGGGGPEMSRSAG